MSSPASPPRAEQSVSVDDLVRELGAQLGAATVQVTQLQLLLRAKDEELRYLRSLQPEPDGGS